MLALLGLGVSGVLLSASLGAGAGLPGCGAGSSACSHVLASRWSQWLGVPVSSVSMLVYAGVLLATTQLHPHRDLDRQRSAWTLLLLLGVLVFGAALWFIGLQAFVLRTICPYCLAVHACGLLVGALVFVAAPVGKQAADGGAGDQTHGSGVIIGRGEAIALVGAGVFGVAALIGAQVLGRDPGASILQPVGDFDSGPASGRARTMSLLGGRVRLKPHDYPILGSPDADQIVVCLFDYTCFHCRAVHRMLSAARRRYGDQLGVVLLPVPLNPDCNGTITQRDPVHEHACLYARLALAVWRADARKFAQFDAQLLKDPAPPGPEAARAIAAGLVGADVLEATLNDPWVDDQIARYVRVQQVSGWPLVPQVVGRGLHIAGRPASEAELFEVLEADLGLRPRE